MSDSPPAGLTWAPPPDEPAASGRFAQLTYTSFDANQGHGGGWGIRQTLGSLTPDEQRFLVSRVSTQFGAGVATTGHRTATEIEALPRRLVHGPTPDGRGGVLWHTAVAGEDASGRPGNVFVHVVLDRAPDEPAPRARSVDTLASPYWLRPYGPTAVLATDLALVPPPPWPPGPLSSSSAVGTFLCAGAGSRGALLAVLLDAVAAAVQQSGRIVVLVAETPARAEQWIAAVGRIMSPGTSRRFYFSTVETRATVVDAHARGLHLIVLAGADAATLAGHDGFVVVHDVDDVGPDGVAVTQAGGIRTDEPHRLPGGESVTVTAWSVLAAEVFSLEPHDAADILDLADATVARVDDRGLPCAWPLAAAVARRADLFPEVQDEAVSILLGPQPAGLDGFPEIGRRIQEMVESEVGRTPWQALEYIRSWTPVSRVPRERAYAIYAERAMHDLRWLTRPAPPDVAQTSMGRHGPDLAGVAGSAMNALAAASLPPVEQALAAIRLIGMIHAYGVGDAYPDVVPSTERLAEEIVAPVLVDPLQGPELVDRVREGLSPLMQNLLRGAVDRRMHTVPRRAGHRLWPGVAEWLVPVSTPATPFWALRRDYPALSPTVVEWAVQRTGSGGDPGRYQTIALWHRLSDPSSPAPLLTAIAETLAWQTADLNALADAFPAGRIAGALRIPVLRLPYDDQLAEALDTLAATTTVPGASSSDVANLRHAARFRRAAHLWWQGPFGEGPDDAVAMLLTSAENVLAVGELDQLAPELHSTVQAAAMIDMVRAPRERPEVERLLAGELRTAAGEAVDRLEQAVRNGALEWRQLACAALIGGPRVEAIPGLQRMQSAASVTVGGPTGDPLLDAALIEYLRQAGRHAADSVIGDALALAEWNLENVRHPRIDEVFRSLREQAETVLDRVRAATPGPGAPRWLKRGRS